MKIADASVAVINFGEQGSVLRITVKDNEEKKNGLKEVPWEDIVVLDVSGSMGDNVSQVVRTTLPTVYTALGVAANKQITVITFSTNTLTSLLTVDRMRSSPMVALDTTNMAGAVERAGEVLSTNLHTPYRVIVISDGMIADKQATQVAAAKLRTRTAERTAPVKVCQVRLKTSNYGEPDTQALTCLGQVDTTGDVGLLDYSSTSGPDGLAKIIINSLSGVTSASLHKIECADQLAFARMPGTPFVKSMQITSEATLILDKSVDVKKITIDGLPLDVSQVSQIQRVTEDDLSSLLQFIETNVKQLMVIGNEPSRIEKILSWVEAVSRSLSTTDEQEQEEVSYHKASTILRRKNLLKELRSTKQSAVQRLLQLGNMSKVANLNSKMQADFLRGVQDGAQGRALARRHTKMGEVDYDAAITKELTALYNGTNLQENRDDLSSFYSLDTPSSCINGLHDFTMNELSLLSTADVLQLVGPLGVTFRANLADAPDPWACFFAHQVYTGESRLLNSADLWTSRTQSGENHEAILKAPGSQDTITGVLPLRSLAPDAFDRLYKLAPTLLSLHVSASLRGSLVPMPGDHAAMATSCAVRMSQQLREQPSTASAQTLLYILKDICESFQQKDMGLKREVIDLLNGNDPRVAMAGDLFIASDLKPHAAVLRGTVNRNSKLARAIVGYNMYLSCGRRFSTPEERAAEIARLLQFSEANETSAGAPNTVDPDVEKVWDTYDGAFLAGQIGVDHLNTLRCVWAVRVAYEKTGGQAEAFLNEFKYQAEEMQNLSILSVNDQHEMKCVLSALYIQALRSPNLASRISVDEATGSREYKLPDVTNVGEAEAYIRGVVREHYAAKLSQKLKAKREAERQALIDILEKELIAAPTGEEFVKLLHSVDGQNKPLFPLREGQLWQNVTAAMLDTGREVPVRTDKLWVLILGRNMQGKPVWCQGNTLRADLKPYMRVFEQMKKENKWEALREIHKKYSLHIYRSHGKNRHGHSNEFPSWWARGYATLDAFQKAEPEEAERYIQERLKAGHLWANPKYQKK